MIPSFGAKHESTRTSSTENFSRTTTPLLPDWLSNPTQRFVNRIEGLSRTDPSSLVSPASALENRASAMAGDLTGSPWNFDRAADTLRGLTGATAPQGEAQSLLTNFSSYSNPFREQVADATMADFDAQAGRTRAAQDLELAGAGAFGGSGAAITKALTEGELSRARNTQLSKLLSDMFTTSAQLSASDADRRQSASFANAQLRAENADRSLRAAQGLGQLSSDMDANTRGNVATTAALGATFRGVDDARARADADWLTAQIGLFGKLPLDLFRGEASSGTTHTTGRTSSTGFEIGLKA